MAAQNFQPSISSRFHYRRATQTNDLYKNNYIEKLEWLWRFRSKSFGCYSIENISKIHRITPFGEENIIRAYVAFSYLLSAFYVDGSIWRFAFVTCQHRRYMRRRILEDENFDNFLSSNITLPLQYSVSSKRGCWTIPSWWHRTWAKFP